MLLPLRGCHLGTAIPSRFLVQLVHLVHLVHETLEFARGDPVRATVGQPASHDVALMDATDERPAADVEPLGNDQDWESPRPSSHAAPGKSSSSPRASRPGPRASTIDRFYTARERPC